eukprot:452123-Prymnesium_polylepis.1
MLKRSSSFHHAFHSVHGARARATSMDIVQPPAAPHQFAAAARRCVRCGSAAGGVCRYSISCSPLARHPPTCACAFDPPTQDSILSGALFSRIEESQHGPSSRRLVVDGGPDAGKSVGIGIVVEDQRARRCQLGVPRLDVVAHAAVSVQAVDEDDINARLPEELRCQDGRVTMDAEPAACSPCLRGGPKRMANVVGPRS